MTTPKFFAMWPRFSQCCKKAYSAALNLAEHCSGVSKDRLDKRYRDACEEGTFKVTLKDIESWDDEAELEMEDLKARPSHSSEFLGSLAWKRCEMKVACLLALGL